MNKFKAYLNQFTKTKFMKTKLLIVLAVVLLLTGAVYLNEYNHNPMAWCFSDHDTCAVKAMNTLRDKKIQAHADNKATFEANEKAINENYDPKIEALKPTISVGAALKEAKEGDKRNIVGDLLTLKQGVIPQAMASDNVETAIKSGDEATAAIFSDDMVNLQRKQRLTAFLQSKGSPFADVDVLQYGREAGLTEQQTALLLGISLRESDWGKDYTSTRNGYRESVPEMGAIYHNPVGIKRCVEREITMPSGALDGSTMQVMTECPDKNRIPDSNGMWIQKYDSYEQFWRTYTIQMKKGYFDRGGTTPETISKCYVQGDCKVVKDDWAATVTQGMNEVLAAIIK